MYRAMMKLGWMIALAAMVLGPTVSAQDDRDEGRAYDSDNYQRQYDDDNNRQNDGPLRIDRYLDVQVWPNRDDGEYYAGDNIVLNFRANRDCFVAIYSVDSRGRVSLLFPADPGDDNFVTGGVTYRLPGGNDRYDLVVDGPGGREQIQMVASREKFPIPNWYRNSGLVFDGDDRDEYMDNLNSRYFARYPGQRFALDRAVVFVSEWEQDYYRPIYSPYYPNWAVTGNMYIDYPWGGSVYVNGLYWGVAPLYIPRLVVGWHVLTIYDPYGYCWESDFHVNRYHTVVFNQNVIKTSRVIDSRYKDLRISKWRDPVSNGYPNFKVNPGMTKTPRGSISGSPTVLGKTDRLSQSGNDNFTLPAKKYIRGDAKLVKTARGYEAAGDVNGERPADRGLKSKPETGAQGGYEARRTVPTNQGFPTYNKRANPNAQRQTEQSSPGVQKRRSAGGSGSSEPTRIEANPPTRERGKEQPKAEPRIERPSGGDQSRPAVKPAPQPSQPNSSGKSKGKGDGGGNNTDQNSGSKGKRPR